MRIGLLAYSSDTGLGYQTLEFAQNIRCEKILIADLSLLNGMQVHHDRYNNLANQVKIFEGIPDDLSAEWLTDDIDILFVCETPLNWNLFDIARKKKVKTVLQYNYEFLEYVRRRDLPKPDVLASPSLWNIEDVKELSIAQVCYLPVPVNTDNFQQRSFNSVNTIVHVMGRPAVNDRNGTEIFLEIAKKLGRRFKYKIFMQEPRELSTQKVFNKIKPAIDKAITELNGNLTIITDVKNPADMYKNAELMVLPRRYGGLCLPLWEAMSSGLPVVMPDISPNNQVLPKDWLVSSALNGTVQTHSAIPMYEANVDIAVSLINDIVKDIELHNRLALRLADQMSWKNRVTDYLALFINTLNEA